MLRWNGTRWEKTCFVPRRGSLSPEGEEPFRMSGDYGWMEEPSGFSHLRVANAPLQFRFSYVMFIPLVFHCCCFFISFILLLGRRKLIITPLKSGWRVQKKLEPWCVNVCRLPPTPWMAWNTGTVGECSAVGTEVSGSISKKGFKLESAWLSQPFQLICSIALWQPGPFRSTTLYTCVHKPY